MLDLWAVCRMAAVQSDADRSTRALLSVKAGVEHLAEKLQHLKAVWRPLEIACFVYSTIK